MNAWELSFLQRMDVPVPKLSADERQMKRLAHRNERHLYKRSCDLCQKTIIALYAAGVGFPVYCSDCFWGDGWDGLAYGQDFDFSRPFFEQFAELQKVVPRVGVLTRNSQNSDYTNCEENSKNCYLTFGGAYSEDCMYSLFALWCKNCLDCTMVEHSELCYEGVDLENCYHCFYLRNSQNCSDCFLSSDLVGCQNCFGCSGLRNKSYHIFNQAFSKEDYEKALPALMASIKSPETLQRYQQVYLVSPHRFAHILNSENCTGDYTSNSQNCTNCFDIKKAKDSQNVYFGEDFQDCYDSNVLYVGDQLVYNSQSVCLNAFQIRCSNFSWSISFSDYCDLCHYSKNLFGCVGLKHKEYCILNKQYSKEEYEALVPRLIAHMKSTGEWGEFFPTSLFPYNDTTAHEYFPLSKAEAIARGYLWREEEAVAAPTPDSSACATCRRPFRVLPQEQAFYTRMGLEAPLDCHECRHQKRRAFRNPRTLWERACGKCGTAIQSTYSPERPETVYCESCYLSAVY